MAAAAGPEPATGLQEEGWNDTGWACRQLNYCWIVRHARVSCCITFSWITPFEWSDRQREPPCESRIVLPDARVVARVDHVAAHVRVGTGENCNARPPVAADLIVGDDRVSAVANQDSHPLGIGDEVVRNEAARVEALHDDGVAGGGGNGALVEHKLCSALDQHGPSHRRVRHVGLLLEGEVGHPAHHHLRDLRLSQRGYRGEWASILPPADVAYGLAAHLDRGAVHADEHRGADAAHSQDLDRFVNDHVLEIDARLDLDLIVGLAAEERRVDRAEDARHAAVHIDHVRRPPRQTCGASAAHSCVSACASSSRCSKTSRAWARGRRRRRACASRGSRQCVAGTPLSTRTARQERAGGGCGGRRDARGRHQPSGAARCWWPRGGRARSHQWPTAAVRA
eukprot:scaffold229322_cov30-Tisochrysis_lutea.AAC.2